MDGKVAAALCKGGVVIYEVEEASGIIFGLHFELHMFESGEVPCQMCLVVGRVALWRLFDPSVHLETILCGRRCRRGKVS